MFGNRSHSCTTLNLDNCSLSFFAVTLCKVSLKMVSRLLSERVSSMQSRAAAVPAMIASSRQARDAMASVAMRCVRIATRISLRPRGVPCANPPLTPTHNGIG